jgi:hypothetical protein
MQPTVLYFHPWEIDPDQPRIHAGLKSRFRHYLNLKGMETKIRYLLSKIEFSVMRDICFKQQQPFEKKFERTCG